ncbi:MAG: hypothetical protein LBG45_10950 [Dysgonamonadaceae bacterium]|jgi:alpha-L-fucosidase|nr:hypothetical protein [Dysgonamonadaceae bacterium]
MKNICLLFAFILLMCLLLNGCLGNAPAPPAPYGAIPDEKQIAWQKLEYCMFIHFGPNTFTDVE